jgi:hypothetical protein
MHIYIDTLYQEEEDYYIYVIIFTHIPHIYHSCVDGYTR